MGGPGNGQRLNDVMHAHHPEVAGEEGVVFIRGAEDGRVVAHLAPPRRRRVNRDST